MITQSLYRYLTEATDLAGHASQPFLQPQTVSGVVCTNRNEVRELLRSKVGKQFYAERLPQDASAHTAVTLRTISAGREYSTAGSCPWQTTVVQVDVFTRGGDALLRGDAVVKLLTLAIESYRNDYWDTVYIGDVTIERETMGLFPPNDGSDSWTCQQGFDVLIHHAAHAAEFAPLEPGN